MINITVKIVGFELNNVDVQLD